VPGGTTIATHPSWFSHFHLHFNERTTRLVSRAVSPDTPRLTAANDSRFQLRYLDLTSARARGVASMVPHRPHRAAHVLVTGQILAPRTPPATKEPGSVRRSPVSMAMSPPLDQRRMLPPGERTQIRPHRGASRNHAAVTGPSRPVRRREVQASRRSTSRPADVSLPAAAAKPPRDSQHPADLTWRTLPEAAALVADRGAHAAAHVAARPAPAAVPSTPDTSTVEARKDRPAILSAASLDPCLLDRLTDDVIRRVERRIRIERERRGL